VDDHDRDSMIYSDGYSSDDEAGLLSWKWYLCYGRS
jgi:hypothetical protein